MHCFASKLALQLLPSKYHCVFQTYWLKTLTACSLDEKQTLTSPDFFTVDGGNLHYQSPFRLEGGKAILSPLKLALHGSEDLQTFCQILRSSGTQPQSFVETKCSMPWCDWKPETLLRLPTLDQARIRLVISRELPCDKPYCDKTFWHDGLIPWERMVTMIKDGKTVDEILGDTFKKEEILRVWYHHRLWEWCSDCEREVRLFSARTCYC